MQAPLTHATSRGLPAEPVDIAHHAANLAVVERPSRSSA